jgi:hypothetical protein
MVTGGGMVRITINPKALYVFFFLTGAWNGLRIYIKTSVVVIFLWYSLVYMECT